MAASNLPEWDLILAAAQNNQAERIRQMITVERVSPNHSNSGGQSAVHVAALCGDVEAVQVLVELGANCRAANKLTGATPLHMVAQSRKTRIEQRIKVVEQLLQGGADPTQADAHGQLPADAARASIEAANSHEDSVLTQQFINLLQPKEPDNRREDMPMTGIVDPQDTDILCGRSGSHMQHPGNKVYRRLVDLHKLKYIASRKFEKQKICKSIVKIIREKKGRFLQKDSKKGTWYDIGDKKAIVKTSQALREGQPKLKALREGKPELKQKVVEMDGGVAGTQAVMESPEEQVEYTPEQIGLAPNDQNERAVKQQQRIMQEHQQQQKDDGTFTLPLELNFKRESRLTVLSDMSASSLGGKSSAEERPRTAAAVSTEVPRSNLSRPSLAEGSSLLTSRGLAVGNVGDSRPSLMSEFSAVSSLGAGTVLCFPICILKDQSFVSFEGKLGNSCNMQNQSQANRTYSGMSTNYATQLYQPQQNNQALLYNASNRNLMATNPPVTADRNDNISNFTTAMVTGGLSSSDLSSGINQGGSGSIIIGGRRSNSPENFDQIYPPDEFARMNGSRQLTVGNGFNSMLASGTNKMLSDLNIFGLSGIFPMDSNMCLSNLSNVSANECGNPMDIEPASLELAKVAHRSSIGSVRTNPKHEVLETSSRHSIMPGLSSISKTSFDKSITSDLSKKMSEISAMDIQEGDNEDECSGNKVGIDSSQKPKNAKEGEEGGKKQESELLRLWFLAYGMLPVGSRLESIDEAGNCHVGSLLTQDFINVLQSKAGIRHEDMAMADISSPLDTDVLCGRQGRTRPGNKAYRCLVSQNLDRYSASPKYEKGKIAVSIVAVVRARKGRFLEKDLEKGTWYDIGNEKAIGKTSQALRDEGRNRQKMDGQMGVGVDALSGYHGLFYS